MRIVVLTGAGISAESGLTDLPRLRRPLGGPRPDAGRHPGGVRRRPGAGPAVLRRAAGGAVAGRAQRRAPRARTARGGARRRPARRDPERRRPPRARRLQPGAPHPRAAAVGLVHALRRAARVGRRAGGPTRLPLRAAWPTLRPDIVWFGEIPYGMDVVEQALEECDLFVSIGTSGVVYPAAAFVHWARRATLELNLEPSAGATDFAESRQGPATDSCPPGSTSCSPDSPPRRTSCAPDAVRTLSRLEARAAGSSAGRGCRDRASTRPRCCRRGAA